jgi:hypothetical protein
MGEPMVEPNDGNEPDPGFDPDQEQQKIEAAAAAYGWLKRLDSLIAGRREHPPVETLANLEAMIAQARAYLAEFVPEDQIEAAEAQAQSRLEAFGTETEPEG